jgi:two-component system, sensor histidine kinase YesM
MSFKISKPIKILKRSMKEVQKGNFDIKVSVESLNEVGDLSKAFN